MITLGIVTWIVVGGLLALYGAYSYLSHWGHSRQQSARIVLAGLFLPIAVVWMLVYVLVRLVIDALPRS